MSKSVHRGAWFGATERVFEFLAAENADQTDDGRFIVAGEQGPFYGLGGDEVVIDDAIHYFVKGEKKNLAQGLAKGDGGIRVAVF